MPGSVSTCGYCGTRAAQVFKSRAVHALSCTSCGAPLGEAPAGKPAKRAKRGPGLTQRLSSAGSGALTAAAALADQGHKVARGPRKSRFSRIVGGALDVIEDILD